MEMQSQRQKEKRTDRGLGSAAKVCLMVKCRSSDSLAPGSSGTLAQGADNENPQLGGQKSPPLRPQLKASVSISPAAQARIGGQRSQHLFQPAQPATGGPGMSTCCSSLWGQNGCPGSGRHHYTEGRARGWVCACTWTGCHVASSLTWAHGGAGSLLEGLALTEGSSVEWGGVGAGPCALLPATATAVGAG